MRIGQWNPADPQKTLPGKYRSREGTVLTSEPDKKPEADTPRPAPGRQSSGHHQNATQCYSTEFYRVATGAEAVRSSPPNRGDGLCDERPDNDEHATATDQHAGKENETRHWGTDRRLAREFPRDDGARHEKQPSQGGKRAVTPQPRHPGRTPRRFRRLWIRRGRLVRVGGHDAILTPRERLRFAHAKMPARPRIAVSRSSRTSAIAVQYSI
jgi:hypothetical protein